jgi:hypothetical protein
VILGIALIGTSCQFPDRHQPQRVLSVGFSTRRVGFDTLPTEKRDRLFLRVAVVVLCL